MNSFRGNKFHTNIVNLDYAADKMDFICVAVLILAVLHMKKSAACNNDDIVVLAGCNVSLNWTIQPTLHGIASFRIYNSLGNKTAEFSAESCAVSDNSSTSCKTDIVTDRLVVSLTIFNVTARQSGNYTLRQKEKLEEMGNTSKKLVVIGKPKIMAVRKSILGEPFELTCNSNHERECYIYRWRINGKYISSVHNVGVYNFSSLNTTNSFSHVTCQVCLNETAGNLSSGMCESDVCSIDSDPYTIQVMYGPNDISLSRNESNYYLKEHEIFTIDCFANCYPNCTFSWKGHDSIKSEKLTISFESRMAGRYTCHVTNPQTNITLTSNPISLHHAEKEYKHKKKDMGVIGMGLVGVAVLLVVMGFSLVIQWRRNASNKTDSRILNKPVVDLRTPTNGEMSQGISRIQNRPLPIPNTQETTKRRPYRPMYPNHRRKSRSLHNLLDSAQNAFYPAKGGLSLQSLYSPSNVMDRSHRNATQDYNSIKGRRFSNCEENQLDDISRLENGIKLELLYAKVRKDKKTNRDEHNADAKSESLNNLRHECFKQEAQENLYSTIDEDALIVYDGARNNSTNGNSNEEQMNTRHGESDYEYADLPVL